MRYVYDIECLKNLFTATFVNADDEKDVHVFYVGLDKNDYSDIVSFLRKRIVLVGYNNHSYDDPMLRYLIKYKGENVNHALYSMSNMLIDSSYKDNREIFELRYPKKKDFSWSSIDLMRILAFDKLGISLKQTAINLKWHKIQDMPIHHDSSVTLDDLKLILEYNLNDVLITKKLYEEIKPIRDLRDELTKLYGVDLSSASDSRMANLILAHIYSTELKVDMRQIKDMRTVRDRVFLGECIAKFVKFQTPQLQELKDRISATIVHNYNNYKYSETISFANCTFSLGIGGLHTEDTAGVFQTDDKYLIQDMDVASYYPNLIINNNFYPKHLGPNFIKVLKKITTERIAAKRAGDKVKADGLKITINSIFGKLGATDFWLLDAKQMLSTTLSGQLGLLMLVEDLHLNGINVISANTDGIVCKIPKDKESIYYEVAHRWEQTTGLELEYTPYKKYVRRDVNSYITEKEDGKTKEKGAFLKEVDLKKAYRMPIVAKALYAYFIKGTPVRQTIEETKDIMEFCISQKSGSNFTIELHSTKGIEKLQKTNRYYITNKGASLIKKENYSDKKIGLNVGRMVRILNDYDPNVPFESYDVDLSFYEKEVMKIVDEIEPKQMSLFDLTSLGNSSITKIETSSSSIFPANEILTVTELNKLGKNQLVKKIETIAKNKQKIENISPRYVFIKDFDSRTMTADIYCLAKGINQTIVFDRKAYKENAIEKGQLVYCNKFEKINNGHCVIDYKITNKIEEQKPSLIDS